MATHAPAARDGRGLRAGARGAEGERDRVSAGCRPEGHCVTCGDEGIADAGRARSTTDARPRAVRGRATASAETVEIALVDAGRRRRRAARARRHGARDARGGGRREVRRRVPRRRAWAASLAGEILAAVEPGRHYKVMEVCGGHTHSIYKYGVDDLLPANVELVHGPGCPVCVIPMGRVDDGIALAHEPGVIFTCFGDMMRVPGSRRHAARGQGRRAPTCGWSTRRSTRCGSPSANPDREVVFFAIGFETTAPSTALTLKRAKAEGVDELLGASATT